MNILLVLGMVAVLAALFVGALVVARKAPTFRKPPPPDDGRERLPPRR